MRAEQSLLSREDRDDEISSADLGNPAQPEVPRYLEKHYWWAYLHPRAVRIFERQWLINLILLGNYRRLRDEVLDELGQPVAGRTLQAACVYGDLTTRLADRLAAGVQLDVVDVAPVQLNNLRRKLGQRANVMLHHQDASDLQMASHKYDNVIAFFLLHEQPEAVRVKTLAELVRCVRPGGKLIVLDYDLPRRWNPLRYLMRPILSLLEPFALDLWNHPITDWMPDEQSQSVRSISRKRYFGGLYQKTVFQFHGTRVVESR